MNIKQLAETAVRNSRLQRATVADIMRECKQCSSALISDSNAVSYANSTLRRAVSRALENSHDWQKLDNTGKCVYIRVTTSSLEKFL